MMTNAKNIRDFADQKARENKAEHDRQVEEEKNYAQQEEAVLRMRGMLEDENAMRKAAFAKQIQMENKRMAQEKRDRE